MYPYDMPTNAELAFWLVALIILAAAPLLLRIFNLAESSTDCSGYIEDVDAWYRNYEKIQRRH